MKYPATFAVWLAVILWSGFMAACSQSATKESSISASVPSRQGVRPGFVIHGGAGVIRPEDMTPERQAAYRRTLEEALLAGYGVLQKGGEGASLDAVETAIRTMEDSPYFNAGKGAVFTADGKNELDASIMDGRTQAGGAVAGVKHIKNPISLARLVMEKSPHVMLVGDGAEQFAKEQGVVLVEQEYFFTQERWDALQKIKLEERNKAQTQPAGKQSAGVRQVAEEPYNKFGTVGAVAVDKNGNLAAGTSTGGMTNKKFGRVGDSPILGAGTYANNNTCAVSATGWGEFFIRLSVARDIAAQVEYSGTPIQQAVDREMKKVGDLGGDGGVIAIDKSGHIGISFNTQGMYRAYMGDDGKPVVEIYKN